MKLKISNSDIINSDCIEHLKKIEDNTFDSVVTDPPYHLTSITKRFGKEGSAPAQYGTDGAFKRASSGFMGQTWDGGEIAFTTEVWQEVYRVLKPGGHVLAFAASRNYHRMAVAIEDSGFEIRDQIMWIYGSGFPKSMNVGKIVDKRLRGVGIGKADPKSPLHGTKRQKIDGSNAKHDMSPLYKTQNVEYEYEHDISKQWGGWGTALKPAHEPIVMARKPISEKTIADNVLKHGTGGINIDECRVQGKVVRPNTNPDFRDVAKKAMAQGGQDKLNFNQVTGARRTTARKPRSKDGVWTSLNSGMKAEATNFADADPRGRFPANIIHDGSEIVQELFPKNKAGKYKGEGSKSGGIWNKSTGKPAGVEYGDEGSAARYFYSPKASKKEKADTKHPTVKPIALMRYLVRLVTPKDGLVLDPFAGTGTTGEACILEDKKYYLIEKTKEYIPDIEKRVNKYNRLGI